MAGDTFLTRMKSASASSTSPLASSSRARWYMPKARKSLGAVHTAGSRWYIHARNIAASVLFVLANGTHGEKYNVQGEIELDNLELAQYIANELGQPLKYKMHDDPITRPGHDLRYALDGDKLRLLGFKLPLTFWESLRKTIAWTLENDDWLDVDSLTGATAGHVLVQAGDYLSILSRGRFRATRHRVLRARGAGTRLSCPLLLRPRDEWQAEFEKRGLKYLPKTTEALRASSSAPKFDSNHRTNPLVFAARGAPKGTALDWRQPGAAKATGALPGPRFVPKRWFTRTREVSLRNSTFKWRGMRLQLGEAEVWPDVVLSQRACK